MHAPYLRASSALSEPGREFVQLLLQTAVDNVVEGKSALCVYLLRRLSLTFTPNSQNEVECLIALDHITEEKTALIDARDLQTRRGPDEEL